MTQKLKIYIGCALTHASIEFREAITDFKDSLRGNYDVLDFTGVLDGDTISASQVHAHDRSCVLDSDVFIAECSYPSTGLGYEIATAVEHEKQILLIAHHDAKVTRMILGIPEEKATFFRYNILDEVTDLICKRYL